jgi:hypothetical protein
MELIGEKFQISNALKLSINLNEDKSKFNYPK